MMKATRGISDWLKVVTLTAILFQSTTVLVAGDADINHTHHRYSLSFYTLGFLAVF